MQIFPGGLWVTCVAELIAEVGGSHVTETANCTWPGEVVAAAMYTLNCCPVHSRYQRRGLGQHKPLEQGEFIITPAEVRKILSVPCMLSLLTTLNAKRDRF